MDYRQHQMSRLPPQQQLPSNNSSSSSSRSSLNSNVLWGQGEAPSKAYQLKSDEDLRGKSTDYLLKVIRTLEMEGHRLTQVVGDYQHTLMVCFMCF